MIGVLTSTLWKYKNDYHNLWLSAQMAHLFLSPTDIEVLAELVYDLDIIHDQEASLNLPITLPGDQFVHLYIVKTQIRNSIIESSFQTADITLTETQVNEILPDITVSYSLDDGKYTPFNRLALPIIKSHLLADPNNYAVLDSYRKVLGVYRLRLADEGYKLWKLYNETGKYSDSHEAIQRLVTDYTLFRKRYTNSSPNHYFNSVNRHLDMVLRVESLVDLVMDYRH